MAFTMATSDNCSFAFASITDGTWKLRVRVVVFMASDKLIEGVHLSLKGVMQDDESEFVSAVVFDNFFISFLRINLIIYVYLIRFQKRTTFASTTHGACRSY